ncbi:hypothetical protein BH20GEM2_BH20GEM2_07920 [soil metagenome]|jgi:LPS export ABC transporter protein LptC
MTRYRHRLLPLVLLWGVTACSGESTVPVEAGANERLAADQIIYGMTHQVTRDGVREATLRADTAFFKESQNRADLVGVNLEFYDVNGQPSGRLTSRTGEYAFRAGSMIARGNVILDVNANGRQRRIETEELHYDLESDRIWSDLPTTSREGSTVYRGTSFESDAKFENVQIKGASTSGGIRTGSSETSF